MIKAIFITVLLLSSQAAFAANEPEPEKTKADTNREVAMTYAQVYLEQKFYQEAENVLQDSVKHDGENGPVLNFLGLIQLQQKNFAQACFSFRTAARVAPEKENKVYALYNFADCLHQSGRKDDTIRTLKELKETEEGVSDSADKALGLLEAGLIQDGAALPPYQKRARGQFRLSAAVAGGFDTNVLLVEEAVATGTAVADRGSFYWAPALQLGYLGRFFGHRMDSRLVTAYTNYTSTNASSFNSLYNRVDLLFGDGTVKWGVFGDLTFLNRNALEVYNWDAGVMWQHYKKTGANDVWIYEVPVRYQRFLLAQGTSVDNDRSGVDLQLKVTYRTQWGDREMFSVTAILDNLYSTGKNYRLSGIQLPASLAIELPWVSDLGLTNTFSAEVDGNYYYTSDQSRRDLTLKGGAGVVTTLFEDWNLNVDYNFIRNNSNVDAATYTKGVMSFLLSHHFI